MIEPKINFWSLIFMGLLTNFEYKSTWIKTQIRYLEIQTFSLFSVLYFSLIPNSYFSFSEIWDFLPRQFLPQFHDQRRLLLSAPAAPTVICPPAPCIKYTQIQIYEHTKVKKYKNKNLPPQHVPLVIFLPDPCIKYTKLYKYQNTIYHKNTNQNQPFLVWLDMDKMC